MKRTKRNSSPAPVRILYADSDKSFGPLLQEFLKREGYFVELVDNGVDALERVTQEAFDILMTETMLPQKDGYDVVKAIRQMGKQQMPLIFLTAEAEQESILRGYECGCDDYILKPCSIEIIMAKVSAMVRRADLKQDEDQNEFEFEGLIFSAAKQMIEYKGMKEKLSSRESELLKMLALRPNRLVERSHLLQNIWRADSVYACRSLSVYVNHLRNILPVDGPVKILSVHGKGYKLVVVNPTNPAE